MWQPAVVILFKLVDGVRSNTRMGIPKQCTKRTPQRKERNWKSRATLENAMRRFEWDDVGVKVASPHLHHLRFADDIVLITSSINQAERMQAEFDETCKKIGLQLNLRKTMFMGNG
ncbi:hypothetical protein RB195_024107 [Necator americanus]|uniref:Reverse transcriptase domain-containing protein n=1 Tax=Necator americanus TaxID=51031 RepID=A0ABR1ELZ6_NECAM